MLSPESKIMAIIPAAGLSRRMGQPKLMMPLGDSTVIGRLLTVLRDADIRNIVVVCRKSDTALHQEAMNHGANIVAPDHDPPDMRSSVELGLDFIREEIAPGTDDAWMLIPADHPVLVSATVSRLMNEWHDSNADILVPVHSNHRGHPTIFSWRLADEVNRIPPDQGLNVLVRDPSHKLLEIEVGDPTVLFDLDTPEDYKRMLTEDFK